MSDRRRASKPKPKRPGGPPDTCMAPVVFSTMLEETFAEVAANAELKRKAEGRVKAELILSEWERRAKQDPRRFIVARVRKAKRPPGDAA